MAVQAYPLLIGADLIRVDRHLLHDAGFVDAGTLEELRHLRTKTRLIGGCDLRRTRIDTVHDGFHLGEFSEEILLEVLALHHTGLGETLECTGE